MPRTIALLLILSACMVRGQSQLSLAQLHQLLKNGLTSERIEQSAADLGLSFELSDADAADLLSDGASPSLIKALRSRDPAQILFERKQLAQLKAMAEAGLREERPPAMLVLGRIYSSGNGAARDYAIANDWFHKAADLGSAPAMIALGDSYRDGNGVALNYEEAVRWYRKADEGGAPGAANRIGQMYGQGRGVPRDDSAALTWYRKAAEEGLAAAMDNVGLFRMNGRGGPRDYAEALRWYRMAAVSGYAPANFHLGLMYERGTGVPQDLAEAVRFYRRAAEAGGPGGMYRLALAYEDGRGIGKDAAMAEEWLEKAAAAGSQEATARLAAPAANTSGAVERVGNGVSAPVVVSRVNPVLSEEARQAKLGGSVTLAMVVDANGNPRDIRVIKGLGMGLDENAVEAVGKWKFNPGMKNGKPVNVRATVEVNFRFLNDPTKPKLPL